MAQDIDKFDPRYLVTLDEIYHSHWTTQKKQRIAFFREIIKYFWPKGHPTQLIEITGTNGKGSVAYYLEQGFKSVSRSGSWTGPHVFDYAERFHINGQQVTHDDIVAAYRKIQELYGQFLKEGYEQTSLSFAETGILMTLHLFEQYDVKWGMMEVGCGGRYTPLMALDMVACVLTNVGNDHPQSLGTELWQRAMDKAGIARPGVPFFTAEMDAALPYVVKTAEAEGANVIQIDQKAVEKMRELQPNAPEFKLRNLALASQVIRYFHPELTLPHLLEFMVSKLPGRFANVAPNVIVDVAHNPDKITRLAEELSYTYPNQKFCFLLGLTRSRDVRQVFESILKLAKRIVITGASYAGQDPESLAEQLRLDFPDVLVENNPEKAYQQELKRLEQDDILVLTGSAYMIDQAINSNPYIRHLNATYGWRVKNNSNDY
ncbi:cyanophycin synthetase [Crocosphaera sp. UHCC 0190]|uniref:glutamate ligase domain-containing protein n=1 Tax=Crocosphaera sp. UHCC 0190 TaxID=3110246 RepID=UPI002B1F6564|nr:cyanophycin synthetase [Crocosphaera sp. UHCC 0190]MEA5510522.1 cyanophycin synthetase [Crocosphaera sp. UHCC 0190]